MNGSRVPEFYDYRAKVWRRVVVLCIVLAALLLLVALKTWSAHAVGLCFLSAVGAGSANLMRDVNRRAADRLRKAEERLRVFSI